jgi:hypothetical protein
MKGDDIMKTKRDFVAAGFFLSSLLAGVFGYMFTRYYNEEA